MLDTNAKTDPSHQLQCTECEHIHTMADRVARKVDGFNCLFCPNCDEESYYNITLQSEEITAEDDNTHGSRGYDKEHDGAYADDDL